MSSAAHAPAAERLFGGRIRLFATDAAVYGMASFLARLFTFVLVPLHTNVLAPAEYGPVGTIYGYMVVLTVLYSMGLETAYLRFAAPDRVTSESSVLSTATLFIAGTGLAASTAITLAREPIARLIGLDGLGHFVATAAWIVALDTMPMPALAWLRLKRRATVFAGIRLISVTLYVVTTVLFLVRWRTGAIGILQANLLASACEVVLLLPVFRHLLRWRLDRELLERMLRFALPLVPAGLAAVVMQFVDRPLLQWLLGDAAVGVYQANSKLAFPMLLMVTVFQYAWQPFFLTRARDRDARTLFARLLVYQLAAALGLFVAVSVFADLVVSLPLGGGRTLMRPEYWRGAEIVPWLLLGYAGFGIYTNLSAGPTLREKTHVFLWVSLAAAAVQVGSTVLLVRSHGLVGAAHAVCLASLVLVAGIGRASHRLYPLEHEWRRLATLVVLALGLWAAFHALGGPDLGVLPRAGLAATYPLVLLSTGFLRPEEKASLRRATLRLLGRGRPRAQDDGQRGEA